MSDSDYEPDATELNARPTSGSDSEGNLASDGDTLQRSDAYTDDDDGYTTGFTTGEDSDGSLFDEDLDPMSLLEGMEQGLPTGGAGAAPQPYELLRQRRRTLRRVRHAGSDDEGGGASVAGGGSDSVYTDGSEYEHPRGAAAGGSRDTRMHDAGTTDDDVEMGDAGPSTSGRGKGKGKGRGKQAGARGGRGAGRGRGRGRAAKGAASSEVFGADVDDIMDPERYGMHTLRGRRGGRGRPRRRRSKSKSKRESDEVLRKLGEANLLYATSQYTQAITLLLEVVKASPNLSDPYHTLGLLHEAIGQPRKALDFFMIAAHLSPKDVQLWKRLAAMSTELGFMRQAIYCLSKVLARAPEDMDARWDRALLFAQVGDLDRALNQIHKVNEARPGDPEVPIMLARVHHQAAQPLRAIGVLEAFLRDHPQSGHLTHVNILAELYMERGLYAAALALIEAQGPAMSPDQPLPLDLTVKMGLCLAQTGQLEAADEQLADLLAEGVEQYCDLYLAVGSTFANMGQDQRALVFLSPLLSHPDFNQPSLWLQLLACHKGLGNVQEGLAIYRTQLDAMDPFDPRYPEALFALAEQCWQMGEQREAEQLMEVMDEVVASRLSAAATSEGAEGAAAAAGGGVAAAGAGGEVALGVMSEELAVRRQQLQLAMGRAERFIASLLPAVEASLDALAADLARVNDPTLPPELKRAVQRKRMFAKRGGRKGEGASETDSVFKGATRRDRRKAKTRQADEAVDSLLRGERTHSGEESDGTQLSGGTGGGGGEVSGSEFSLSQRASGASGGSGASDSETGNSSGGELNSAGGRRAPARLPRGSLVGRSVANDPAQVEVMLQVALAMATSGRGEEASGLMQRALAMVTGANRKWFDRNVADRLRLGAIEVALAAGLAGPQEAQELRALTQRWPHSLGLWSLYCRCQSVMELRTWSMHIGTMRRRHVNSVPITIMQGHVHALSRQHRDAVCEYLRAYHSAPREPLLLLCLAVALISEAMSTYGLARPRLVRVLARMPHDRNRGVLLGFAFLQAYAQQRGPSLSQEVSYNMGRAAHQLGLNHLAAHYYEQALDAAPPAAGLPAPRVDLRREAAHNLVLLYRASGATELARQVMMKHLVV